MNLHEDVNALESILLSLNNLLEDNNLSKTKWDRIVKKLKKLCDPKFGLVDFKYFDEKRLKKAGLQRQKGIRLRNFEYACNQLYLEWVCQKYIELRKLIDIGRSRFIFEKNFLIFCHYGTSPNDAQIITYILKEDRYLKLNIKI